MWCRQKDGHCCLALSHAPSASQASGSPWYPTEQQEIIGERLRLWVHVNPQHPAASTDILEGHYWWLRPCCKQAMTKACKIWITTIDFISYEHRYGLKKIEIQWHSFMIRRGLKPIYKLATEMWTSCFLSSTILDRSCSYHWGPGHGKGNKQVPVSI